MTATTAGLGAEDLARLHRRTLVVVMASQVFGGAGLAAGITVGALLAEDMLGTDSVGGVPTLLFTLGSAAAAYLVGSVSQRRGRRVGLAGGFAAGAAGAVGIVVAAVLDSPWLLFPALLVYGAGTATNLQARYAGTDLAPPAGRATAVSLALVSTTFGAVAGPNLVDPLGRVATGLGLPALTGPFLLAAVAYGLAALVLAALLRPDPLLVARALAAAPADPPDSSTPDTSALGSTEPASSGDRVGAATRGVLLGGTVMVLTQVAMVAIMTMTPVHMRDHGHGLGDVGFVIGLHVAAMFLPSLVTGRLVDVVGRVPMALASAAILLAAGVLAAAAPAESMALLTVALVLLGLGWNLGLISGTALVVDATTLADRARVQGSLDVLVALAGATGGGVSGLVVGAAGYATLALGGGLVALFLLPVVFWRPRSAAPDYPR